MEKEQKENKQEMKQKCLEVLETMESYRITDIGFGGYIVKTPGFMPIINGTEDLKIVLRKKMPPDQLHGIVINLYNAEKILIAAKKLEKNEHVNLGVKWSDLIKETPVFFDPIPELFYLQTKPYCRNNLYATLRKEISDLPESPNEFFTKMKEVTTKNHVKIWREIIDNGGKYHALLRWLKAFQMGNGSPVTIPLTPFIDGWEKSGSLNLSINANLRACEFLREIMDVPAMMYFGINHVAFREEKTTLELNNRLYNYLSDKKRQLPNGIIFKIRHLSYDEKDDKAINYGNLKNFFTVMGNLGAEFDIPLFLFQGGTYGLPAIEHGFDSFSDRLNGSLDDPIDPDPELEVKILKEFQYGKIYHPEKKINLQHSDFQKIVTEEDFPKITHTEIPSAFEESTVQFRRNAKFYRIAARCDEVRKIRDNVGKNPRALAEEFARSEAKNVEKLLKYPF